MRDGYNQLVEYAFWAWSGQRWHGLSGVGNVRGGVWVVLKLEWQPLHLRAPPVKSCRVQSSPPPASSSPFPPSWPLWQHGGFLLLVQPHHHLSLCGSSGAFCFSFSPITTFFFLLALAAASILDPKWMLHLLRTSYKFKMYC